MAYLLLFVAILLVTLISLLTVVVGYFKRTYEYWARRKVPFIKPQIPFGNAWQVLCGHEHIGISIKRMYDEINAKGWKYGGVYIFTTPNLIISDLDLMKRIMTKDFHYFMDKKSFYNEKTDPLGVHLSNFSGNRWKDMRSKVSPTFSPSKMKIMFETLADCKDNLKTRIITLCKMREPLDVKTILSDFTINAIGACIFGLDLNTLQNQDSLFRVYARAALNPSKFHYIKKHLVSNFPKLFQAFNIGHTKDDITKFILTTVEDTVNYREKNNVKRNDFMQILIDLKNKGLVEERLTMNEVAAQCFLFLLAGFESSASLISLTLYELSKHQDIQNKVRTEVNKVLVKYDGTISYECLQDMKYLTQVMDEILRLYPPTPLTSRKCNKEYKIPDSDVIIEEGTNIIIPIMGLHYNSDFYPEPEKFDPERFSEDIKASRDNYTHLPFGSGPRMCLGMSLALVESKLALAMLLKDFKFTLNGKTVEPLQFDPAGLFLTIKQDIWLNVEKV